MSLLVVHCIDPGQGIEGTLHQSHQAITYGSHSVFITSRDHIKARTKDIFHPVSQVYKGIIADGHHSTTRCHTILTGIVFHSLNKALLEKSLKNTFRMLCCSLGLSVIKFSDSFHYLPLTSCYLCLSISYHQLKLENLRIRPSPKETEEESD